MRTALQEAYVFDTVDVSQLQTPVINYIAGYSEVSRNPHWACNRANPNCPVHRRHNAVFERIADIASWTGAVIVLALALIVTFGPVVAPLFV